MENSITINSAIGKIVKALRVHFKYSQVLLALEVNITVKTLANIENGRVGLDIEKLYRLSRFFSVPIGLIPNLAINIVENGRYCKQNESFEEVFVYIQNLFLVVTTDQIS